MTKYYFISYVGINSAGKWLVGHCTVKINNTSLPEIANALQEETGARNPVTIICLKDLSKEEYEMLNGNSDKPDGQ